MVEVFRTNVKTADHAIHLIEQIHEIYVNYRASFDLDDCDKILRVSCDAGYIEPSHLILLLKNSGFRAELLPDS